MLNRLLEIPGIDQGITYLLRDEFLTAQSAPLTSPRIAEPGPGQLTITDSGNTLSISGGALVPTNKTTGARDPWVRETAGRARVIGRALTMLARRVAIALTTTNNEPVVGWVNTLTTPDTGQSYGLIFPNSLTGGFLACTPTGFVSLVDIYGGAGQYFKIAVVERNPGFWLILDNKLAWVCDAGSESTLYPAMYARSANVEPGGLENIEIVDWGAINPLYSTQYGWVTSRSASPTSGDTFVVNADGLIEFKWVPAAGETLNMMFRRTDDNNTYLVRSDHSGGANDNTIKLINKQSGSEVVDATSAQTFSNGSTYRIVIMFDGLDVRCAVNDSTKLTYRNATYNKTVAGGKITGHSNANGNLVAWPITPPTLDAFNFPTKGVKAFCYGDSVTMGSGDTGELLSTGYPIYLSNYPTTAIHTVPARVGVSGMAVEGAFARIDSDLAAAVGNPDVVLIYLGLNNVKAAAPVPNQVTMETELGYICDQTHAKWPNAIIYLSRIYATADNGSLGVFNSTYIPNVVNARSAWARLGPNLPAILNPSLMADALHPNHDGHLVLAAAWRNVLGY